MFAQVMLFGSASPGVVLSANPVTTNSTAVKPYFCRIGSQACSSLIAVVDGDQHRLGDTDVRARKPLLVLLERDRLVAVRLQIGELRVGLGRCLVVDRVAARRIDLVVVEHRQID